MPRHPLDKNRRVEPLDEDEIPTEYDERQEEPETEDVSAHDGLQRIDGGDLELVSPADEDLVSTSDFPTKRGRKPVR